MVLFNVASRSSLQSFCIKEKVYLIGSLYGTIFPPNIMLTMTTVSQVELKFISVRNKIMFFRYLPIESNMLPPKCSNCGSFIRRGDPGFRCGSQKEVRHPNETCDAIDGRPAETLQSSVWQLTVFWLQPNFFQFIVADFCNGTQIPDRRSFPLFDTGEDTVELCDLYNLR